MKIVRLFNIQWDTDDEDPDELGLPHGAYRRRRR